MRRTRPLLALLTLAAAPLLPGLATPAQAQYGGGATGAGIPSASGLGGGGMGGLGGGMPQQQQSRRPQPAALPGLVGRRTPEPIPPDPNANLSPNAALFDAINRGDLPAVREAVSRGADLDSRNVLGLSPIDAAVDQGRNEILFYLLSARGSRAAPPAARPGDAPETAGAPPRDRRTAAREAAQARRAEAAEARVRSTATPIATQVNAPRLWAGDGGAAQPEIGFLGFDAGRPAGAVAPAGARTTGAAAATRRYRGTRG
ncbi:ankyrin repeat domain-containing protein [Roseomonas sp. NAR14]|uniref:Ankyrin repeat domain-containing protein n=1 Tax=Roseomonas acroporae TaxID=2937791 RepID=A0A9X1YB44_9PROT|nr:ankyrin repeat domain-containing protein [Roseomonas acroporae]MCK8786457.1 ankyrin repeat domain-containing protein [Roseomonas acroporae]